MAATRAEHDWLTAIRSQVLRGGLPSAQPLLLQALAEYPASVELRRAQAGAFRQAGREAEAESLLRGLLSDDPGDTASAFALSQLLQEQGRTASAAAVMRTCLAAAPDRHDTNVSIQAIELLDDSDRKADAAAIAQAAIEANPDDPRLHAYAGMLQIQLGEFEAARRHYLFALEHAPRAWEWHVPIGLASAQRYDDPEHPDFNVFRDGLKLENLSDKARAELHFALGKAHDDIGDYEQAARHFRDGNAIAHRLTTWSRKTWRRAVEARLASRPTAPRIEPSSDFTPIFIVGMPRSGTTLLAGLLSRYPKVCNRGELPWIAQLAERPALAGNPGRNELQSAAAMYRAQTRQDDAGDARWFIDKQPLNFRYIDLMLALFPDAKILHCQRSPRDIALSLWMQCFLEDVQGYAYDFDDIALVMRDCDRLMTHWGTRYPDSIRTMRYEELVANPASVAEALAQWLGLPPAHAIDTSRAHSPSTISTASLWQARQPVNTRSVDRWKHYEQYTPDLLQFSRFRNG